MKKFFLTVTCLLAVVVLNAQSLEEIVKNYTSANNLDQLSKMKTVKITASMSMMGMDVPMVLWMKNPDKIKTVMNIQGQEIISAFDGEKGWVVNPMQGSPEPQEMSMDQVKQTENNNVFVNNVKQFLSNGQLTLVGEEAVNGSPAYKLKATPDGTNEILLYIDKSTYRLVKTSTTVNQQGMSMTVDSYPSDYKQVNGVYLPMKTTSNMNGMDIVQTFTNIEFDIPMEDSLFKQP